VVTRDGTLRIDRAALEGMRLSLDAVARNFEGLHEWREEQSHIWGDHAMRDAMGHFADNWTTHRDTLRRHTEELAGNCEAVLRHFDSVDAMLTAAIRPNGKGPE
jgi:hypothetical protein